MPYQPSPIHPPAHPAPSTPPPPARRQVLINRRHGPVRNLLNSAALVQACNDPAAWRGLAGAQGRGSPIRRVQCREAGLGGDGLANMAAVRAADVLVCLHGAACTNWLFMSKGSALLEIRWAWAWAGCAWMRCALSRVWLAGARLAPPSANAAGRPPACRASGDARRARRACDGSRHAACAAPVPLQALPVWVAGAVLGGCPLCAGAPACAASCRAACRAARREREALPWQAVGCTLGRGR